MRFSNRRGRTLQAIGDHTLHRVGAELGDQTVSLAQLVQTIGDHRLG
jgi:hypothetical protein